MTRTEVTTSPFADSLEQLLAGLAYVDLRVRWAVERARSNGLNPDDEFRGLYISDEQIDTLMGYEPGHHLWAGVNGHGVAQTNGPLTADGRLPAVDETWPATLAQTRAQWQSRTQASREVGIPLALDQVVERFDLSPLEVDALLIALAPELDPRYERFFAYLQDDVTRKRPSVGLVLNLLTDSFRQKLRLRHFFTAESRLIQSRLLVRFSDSSGLEVPLLAQYLRPAPNLVEHLLGHSTLDSKLAGCARLLPTHDPDAGRRLASGFVNQLVEANKAAAGQWPFFTFIGGYGVGKREAAQCLARATGRPLLTVDLPTLLNGEVGLNEGMSLILRDGRLVAATLYLIGWASLLQDGHLSPTLFQQLLDYPYTVIVTSASAWQPAEVSRQRPVFTIYFDIPDYERRRQIWQDNLSLSEDAASLDLSQIANHFRFTPGQIEDALATARDLAQWRQEPLTTADLFAASRAHSNQKLITLAAKIQPRYGWQDIILPGDTLSQLKEMVNMVRQRPLVYSQWGFERKLALGKGLNALFAGESGTGKTMAADIMAGALGLDLYKIDLSTLVSKYIGETEKNLDRIFTEATTSNAILFFDEADAIFGKRSEVKDSHDRYANIEISYLLQRMEAYDGVVILATNLRANLDDAFTRRLHFAIEFPFPEASDRERIWRVNFPAETPIAPDVDFRLLAERFRLAGGNIRNIILAAAFLAAEAKHLNETPQAVGMAHLLHATRREYQKMGRLIDERLFIYDAVAL
jgi:AAA+ superfamily predicted ATPase